MDSVNARLVRCRRCGLVYTNPRLPDKDIFSKLCSEPYLGEKDGRRLTAAAILKSLKAIRKNGRLLDVGCRDDVFAVEARKDGWEPVLSDPSQGMPGRDYPDNYFDAIVINGVIEHLPDPKAVIVELKRSLKADGILYINTPDINSIASRIFKTRWWGVKESRVYYFTKSTLTGMLKSCGFVPVITRGYSRYFSLGYVLNRLKNYSLPLYRAAALLVGHDFMKDRIVRINLGDQVEIYCRKARRLEYLDELEGPIHTDKKENARVIAVLPAYNAADTLERTIADIPRDVVDEIILVDDVSGDDTVKIAEKLGLKVYRHGKRTGYGGNQKTCYEKALELGADIAIMVHPDYQYDPKIIPQLIEPIISGRADAVFGSRMMKGGALIGGMPPWKHNANILLTAIENVVFGTYLTEYHSGFRAYSRKSLCSVDFKRNSDSFIFDTEIIAQLIVHNLKIEEIPIKTRYFDEASSIKLFPSIAYGLGILGTLFKFWLHTHTFVKLRRFK
ncbi:MAG: methyltransferase domain-containing protein [Candidatus Omnitrophota bacterium]|jgi:SAM-dependent methyltransferase